MVNLSSVAVILGAASLALAHPGEKHDHAHVKREIQQRDHLAARSASSLAKCAGSIKARALQERAVARRAATAEKLRAQRGISDRKPYHHRRDLAALQEFEVVNHNMTGAMTTSDPAVLFGANTSCILTPENTIGPYYVLGEYIRQDVTEGQAGMPVHLDMQFVDTNTCEPVEGLLIDIWAANATGVYSGIDASSGQGGLNTTYLRGLQQSDAEGVVEFDTLFPGHYEGRATHEHVVAHVNATALPNGTFAGGTVAHIGQIFFDESLRSAVELTSPYNTNDLPIVSNDDDMWAPTQADNNYDPFPEFMYLNSEDITDGLLMWISIGVDTTANYSSSAVAAAYLAADGGHSTGNSIGGGAPGEGSGSGGNGTIPSGFPSGVVPSDVSAATDVSARSYNEKKLYGGAARRGN
ncbi:aromatic compound dioxygenase [Saccharata proteae CBS 121410]|uniref:Aromatic compound dioxygenase n=1 Tax=Saccharata proteae CBS 121410 TaxID=1314787 RepID=A0A9P4M2K6_9PEZI|nr:aromatic compound dioxygenase [Saccharata proteae CBS 121410]